ncbi:MAG: glycosyltransferase family 9 protein [Candidatus Gastranaerophilaceae bacterium]|jgi:ADP-heptose:LPS heptosyltransferase
MKKAAKTILVINMGYIGDVINASPVCYELKKNYPNSQLVFITDPSSVVTAQHLSGVDHAIGFDRYNKHKGWKIFEFAFNLRKKYKFDLAILLTENFRAAILAFLLGAKVRIGRSNEGRDILLTHKIPFSDEERELKVHVIEHYMRVLAPLGLYNSDYCLNFNYSQSDADYIESLLSDNDAKNHNLIGLCPATGMSIKNWNVNEASMFIQHINKLNNYKVVLIGTKDCREFSEKLKEMGTTDFIDLSCKTTIPQLAALISKFKKFVSIDTGPMHLAFALKISTVCLFFQDNYKKWGPTATQDVLLTYKQGNTGHLDVISHMNL